MKIANSLSFLAAIPFFLTACSFEQNDLFSDSATIRIEKKLKEYEEVMTGADKGWVFTYYPAPEKYGAFNFLVQFDADGSCVMQSDKFLAEKKETSLYQLDGSQGPVLSFTTYNMLHKLADPTLYNYGSGWEGESEFTFIRMSENQDTLYLAGKKRGYEACMYRNTYDWDTYFSRINGLVEQFTAGVSNRFFRSLALPDGTDVVLSGYNLYTRSFEAAYQYSEDSVNRQNMKVAFDYDGIHFLTPLDVNGKQLQKFDYEESTQRFISNELGDPVILQSVNEPAFQYKGVQDHLLTGAYDYIITGLTPELNDLYSALATKFYEATEGKYSIYAVIISCNPYRQYELLVAYKTESSLVIGANSIINFEFDKLRPDKYNFSCRRNITVNGTFGEEVKEEFINFYKGLFFQTQVSYIAVPSHDFKEFTFGSTLDSRSFTVIQW